MFSSAIPEGGKNINFVGYPLEEVLKNAEQAAKNAARDFYDLWYLLKQIRNGCWFYKKRIGKA